MRLFTILSAVISVVSAESAEAQTSARGPLQDAINNLVDPIRWSSLDSLDVAGVQLGMTPTQARSVLASKGFEVRAEDATQPSWNALVSAKVLERRSGAAADRTTIPSFTVARGSQGERIEVWYGATRTGVEVTAVNYSIPANHMAQTAFLEGVVAKYGRPTFAQPRKLIFCTRGSDSRASCAHLGDVTDRPGIIASASHGVHTIKLMEGSGPSEARKARLAADVEKAAPPNAQATF